ncbi:MAG TPA: TadE family protein [Acidimicrobiales bacterium]|jgi:Flp pilus assembly protein TadG|nr:TadE family protein [Acidimicrobiales bacterium]
MVEFALVVGIFVMVLYGLIYFGMALATKQRVTNAAAEGARAAVGQPPANAASVASTRVNTLLGGTAKGYTIGPDPTGPRIGNCDTNPALPANSGAQCVWVTITWDWANHPVVPAAPGLRIFPINSLSSTAVVQYSS